MTDQFRTLCAELDALLNDIASTHPNLSENGVKVINDLSDRARALLAQPVPKLPYDSCCDVSASAIRADFLAIAAELEGHQ